MNNIYIKPAFLEDGGVFFIHIISEDGDHQFHQVLSWGEVRITIASYCKESTPGVFCVHPDGITELIIEDDWVLALLTY